MASEICKCPTCGTDHLVMVDGNRPIYKSAPLPPPMPHHGGEQENLANCIEDVKRGEDNKGNWLFRQCSRRRGYGNNKLYCKQHGRLHPIQSRD